MNMHQLKGHWKGEFTYGPDYGEVMTGVKEKFSLVIEEVTNGSFKGKCVDLEMRNSSEFIQSHIKGFLENNFISFTKEYPYQYLSDEDGNAILDKNKKGHTVTYEGEFNVSTNCFSGTWEIVSFVKLLWFRWFVQRAEGTWSMYKEL
jgi:hypothetical protein